jgi:putative phage-type endonuclease
MQALKLVSTLNMQKDEWLDYRRQGIGGSDVSAICNMNRYRSPMAVYLDKIGKAPEIEENEYMYWGNVLEDVVATEFSIRSGLKVRRENKILQHPKYPFMLANVDRLIVGQNAGLECKTASEYAKDDWIGESVPKEYALQCHHYMACTGLERWFVAVLIGGNKFEWRVIERDDSIIDSLIDIESNFWNNHVIPRVAPAFGAHDETLLSQMYPQSKPSKSMELPPEAGAIVQAVYDSKNRLEEAKFDFEDNKNKIKGFMGDAELAWWNCEPAFSWKSGSKSRTFRILGGNEA